MSYDEYSKLKIIPSCITTASCIGALTTMEVLKYLELEYHSNSNNHFFNLANNLYITSEPSSAKIIKKGYSKLMECEIIPIPAEFSKWDNYIYNIQTKTKLMDLKLYLEQLYSITIDKIISFQSSVYDSDLNDNSLDLKLNNGDLFEVSGYDTNYNMIIMPKIKCLAQN